MVVEFSENMEFEFVSERYDVRAHAEQTEFQVRVDHSDPGGQVLKCMKR